MSTSSASGAMPGLPGAAKISVSRGLRTRASTSACSRPPLPTTSRRTALSLYPLDYRLVPLGSDADHAQRNPKLGLDELYEVACLLGQLLPSPACGYIHAPAGERLVNRAGVVEVGLMHGKFVHPIAVDLVPYTHLYFLKRREHVEHREGEPIDAV